MKNKRRFRAGLNFVAFTVLFFALYLNFIHKDSNTEIPVAKPSAAQQTVLITNPDAYLKTEHQKLPVQVAISNPTN